MIFRYRDSETQQLNGPNTYTPGTSSINEADLTLFLSTNGGNTFIPQGRDNLNTTTNELTRAGITQFATFTLGDRFNPLPVTLTSLEAKRIGNDAQVAWETANETNNKGFEVQVSTNGSDFRTLGFVAAAATNSSAAKSYTFLDVEKNKTGDRYYRLRQIDVDGKDYFFGPRVVNFSGKATEGASLLAYPNPFNSADQVHLTLQSASAGKGSVTVTDMTGRTVRQQTLDLGKGNNDVTVEQLGDLKAGVYMVRLTQPNGQVQSLKVVKQ
nr:T9SS type A sorting domain-containing protein [Hymenobacter sp. BT523]